MKPIKTLLVDDEPLARENLDALLAGDPDIAIVGQCANGTDALHAIRRQRPELVFLDVQMPGLTGFDVLAALPAATRPAVVFVTAYDRHALKAFEVHAVDYLLKPFSRARFAEALAHAKSVVREEQPRLLRERLTQLLASLGGPAAAVPAANDARLLLRIDGEIHVVNPADIRYVESDGSYLRFHLADGKSRYVRMTFAAILAKLDARFLRIHRSTLVNLDHVAKISPAFFGEYSVQLAGGGTLKVSRTFVPKLKARM